MTHIPNGESWVKGASIGDTVQEQGVTYTLTAPAFGMDTWDGGARGGLIEMGSALTPGYSYKFNGRWFRTFASAVTKATAFQKAKYDWAKELVEQWEAQS